MSTEELFAAIQTAMTAARITDPVFRCMILAMAEQESIGRNGPTTLAVEHHNIFGFKGIIGLETVTLPANEFETVPQRYSRFPTYKRCIKSAIYSIFRSEHYARARAAAGFAFSEALDQRLSEAKARAAWCAAWILAAGPTWAPPNPTHGREVQRKFDRWLEKLKVEV